MDMATAQLTSFARVETLATVAKFEPRSSSLLLGGGDGLVRVFDLRSGYTPVGAANLFPRGVVHDLDIEGTAIIASALTTQLGPLGQQEVVFDSALRTADLRMLSRQGAELYFAPGAAAVRWHTTQYSTSSSSVLVASPGGALQLLDARGGMTAPAELQTSVLSRSSQLCGLAISSSGMLIAASDTAGCIDVLAPPDAEYEHLSVNAYSNPTDAPDPPEEGLPHMDWESSAGSLLLLPEAPEGSSEPLASSWPANLLGKRGTRYATPQDVLSTIRTLPPQVSN